MAWSTPATWVAGAVLTAAQLNAQLRDNLNAAFPLGAPDVAWTAYTPTLTQNATLTKTVTYARYQRVGRLIHAVANLAITSAGSAANPIEVGLPVAAVNANAVVGVFRYLDAGATIYAGTCFSDSISASFVRLFVSGNATPFGQAPAVTAASGDAVVIHVTYEAAT